MSQAPAIVCVDKPSGATSHDVVQWVRWALRVKAVGHFGTLDPAATGLLVLGVGAATRLGPILTGLDKSYAATIVLGRSTTTADAEGDPVLEASCGELAADALRVAAEGLQGSWQLPPPAVSAIHIDGQRAHARVRAGETVEMPNRPMTVSAVRDIVVTPGQEARVRLSVDVSKGTYVRSLAEELGRRLGVPAHLGQLRRLRVGSLTVDDAGTVAGLHATGAPPRARVAFADLADEDPDRRETAAARLQAALHPPWHGLPVPVVAIADGEGGQALWTALGHGQRPTPTAGQLRAELPGQPGWVAIRAAGPALFLCELDDAGTLHPKRRVAPADA
jgi:tRNA pseudouridine55 synthase